MKPAFLFVEGAGFFVPLESQSLALLSANIYSVDAAIKQEF
ncbi:hypothetical protein imdm_1412 [gamma proteobacterium IMCC2047]|nr:hypothetical protein imdm_1412 [gamma proteobacterium IMCC2047]